LPRFEIRVVPENCTGCLRCSLACSELQTGRFTLADGLIRIGLDDFPYTIVFMESCTRCGVCADHCLYGAIVKQDKGAQP
jgi:ferredoxin